MIRVRQSLFESNSTNNEHATYGTHNNAKSVIKPVYNDMDIAKGKFRGKDNKTDRTTIKVEIKDEPYSPEFDTELRTITKIKSEPLDKMIKKRPNVKLVTGKRKLKKESSLENCNKKLKVDNLEDVALNDTDTANVKLELYPNTAKKTVGKSNKENLDFQSDFKCNVKQETLKLGLNNGVVIKNEDPDLKQITNTTSKKKQIKKDPLKCVDELVKAEDRCNFEMCRSQVELEDGVEWETQLLAEDCNIGLREARNIVNMFRNDCTVPFIARYRCEQTGNMDADMLRYAKECYIKIKNLEVKKTYVLKQIQKSENPSPYMKDIIYSIRSTEELEHIYAPYKSEGKKTKAGRARELGLEQISIDILEGNEFSYSDVLKFADPKKSSSQAKDDIHEGIKHIIADMISKNREVLDYTQLLMKEAYKYIVVNSSEIKSKINKKENKQNLDAAGKFESYYDFRCTVWDLKPHQILALNRGQRLKILNIKFTIPDNLFERLRTFCCKKWLSKGRMSPFRDDMFEKSIQDAYIRLIQPLMIRRIRSYLNKKAEHAAIENFASNLKSLLLTPPVRGLPIFGIDPGFRNGCKVALISAIGNVLWTDTLYFDFGNRQTNDKYATKIKEVLLAHKCEFIAIGNGTGSRNMEEYITGYIKKGFFKPELDVQYTIVNERGSSIYSCSSIAKEEFPDLKPNLISAVFIARSLQDPLSELVKVEPKHLGVGMYQHDIPKKELEQVLDEIVTECVSFAGVDVNVASVHLLKRVSGLNNSRALNIIEWRNKYGSFVNREQLTLVKGIGKKTFEQCSGFIRIIPETAQLPGDEGERKSLFKKNKMSVNEDFNLLDRTWIHPESYSVALKFLELCNAQLIDMGSTAFIQKIEKIVNQEGLSSIWDNLGIPDQHGSLIIKAFTMSIDHDYRSKFSKPHFRKSLTSVQDLHIGTQLTGCVSNMTDFGAFIDIGVGCNGLIHTSKMYGKTLNVGDRVLVDILNVDAQRKRIALSLVSII